MDDSTLVPLLLAETEKQYKNVKQNCDAPDDWPVCAIANGDVWPMVVIYQVSKSGEQINNKIK